MKHKRRTDAAELLGTTSILSGSSKSVEGDIDTLKMLAILGIAKLVKVVYHNLLQLVCSDSNVDRIKTVPFFDMMRLERRAYQIWGTNRTCGAVG
jgi:hypothetical protein